MTPTADKPNATPIKNIFISQEKILVNKPKIITIINLDIPPVKGMTILPVPWLAKYNVFPPEKIPNTGPTIPRYKAPIRYASGSDVKISNHR